MSDTVQPPVCNVCNSLHKFQAGSLPRLVSVVLFPVNHSQGPSAVWLQCSLVRAAFAYSRRFDPRVSDSWVSQQILVVSVWKCMCWATKILELNYLSFVSTVVYSSERSLNNLVVKYNNSDYGYRSFNLSKKAKQFSSWLASYCPITENCTSKMSFWASRFMFLLLAIL